MRKPEVRSQKSEVGGQQPKTSRQETKNHPIPGRAQLSEQATLKVGRSSPSKQQRAKLARKGGAKLSERACVVADGVVNSPAPSPQRPKTSPQRPKTRDQRPKTSPRSAFSRLKRNKMATTGIVILIVLSISALLAPVLTPYNYDQMQIELGATPPSAEHWLGTDTAGRDLLTRILYGGRVSLAVGLCATFVSLLIGVTYGAVAGYAGGKTDEAMMRLVDILYSLPFTVFVIILMVVFGQNIWLLFVAIGAVEWLTMARIVRGQVLAIKQKPFIKAASVLGYSHQRIIARHIIPNILGPVIVYTTLTIPRVMLLESFLSFLGLGIQPPMSSWGLLIRDGAKAMETFPWLLIFPGIVLSTTLFALNFLGDGLRDALDPRATK